MASILNGNARAVFFDLDGTLVDTAPDMIRALQDLQLAHNVEPIPYELGRSHVSNGAMGLLKVAFPDTDVTPQSPLLSDFIARYAADVCSQSALFEGLADMLDRLDAGARPWGVVTNKPAQLTLPILQKLALASRSACTVSGDTLPMRKPDPAQLLHACKAISVAPQECIYVGDAARDIEAGARAGMVTIAVGYGYIVAGDDPGSWGADKYAASPDELAHIVLNAVNLES